MFSYLVAKDYQHCVNYLHRMIKHKSVTLVCVKTKTLLHSPIYRQWKIMTGNDGWLADDSGMRSDIYNGIAYLQILTHTPFPTGRRKLIISIFHFCIVQSELFPYPFVFQKSRTAICWWTHQTSVIRLPRTEATRWRQARQTSCCNRAYRNNPTVTVLTMYYHVYTCPVYQAVLGLSRAVNMRNMMTHAFAWKFFSCIQILSIPSIAVPFATQIPVQLICLLLSVQF